MGWAGAAACLLHHTQSPQVTSPDSSNAAKLQLQTPENFQPQKPRGIN